VAYGQQQQPARMAAQHSFGSSTITLLIYTVQGVTTPKHRGWQTATAAAATPWLAMAVALHSPN